VMIVREMKHSEDCKIYITRQHFAIVINLPSLCYFSYYDFPFLCFFAKYSSEMCMIIVYSSISEVLTYDNSTLLFHNSLIM